MQQTQDTPQPQDSQTQNPQNNSSNDNAYESIPVSSTTSTDSNCLIIDEDEHNVTKDIFSDHTDDSSVKTTDKANDSDNCTDEDDFDLNNPKTFDESSKEDNPAPDKQQTRRYNQTVTVSLPTTQQVVTYQKWNNQPIEELPREQRIAAKGMYAKAVNGSPPNPELHTREKKAYHKACENAKTLYGSYDCVDGGQTSSGTVGMLWVIVKHVKREHIELFYRTSPHKFANLKEYYNHEINFKGKVGDHDHTFRILPKPPPKICPRFQRLDENEVFLTMFLPTTISDTAVHLAFHDSGTVHQVFAGTYKKDFHEIQNGKRHMPHQIRFEERNKEFVIYWAEKEVLCKK